MSCFGRSKGLKNDRFCVSQEPEMDAKNVDSEEDSEPRKSEHFHRRWQGRTVRQTVPVGGAQ